MQERSHILPNVQRAFEIAVHLACGIDHVEMFRNECPVKLSTNWRKYGDMICAFPKFFYSRMTQANPSEGRDGGGYGGSVNVCSTSEYNLIREFTYTSSKEVAEAIVSFLPEEEMGPVVAAVHIIDRSDNISITTAAHLRWHLDADRYPCGHCGRFCQGKYGIRTHLVNEHRAATEIAREKVLHNALQLVVYSPPVAPLSSDADTLSIEPTSPQPTPHSDPNSLGLEAAKRGDTTTLAALAEGRAGDVVSAGECLVHLQSPWDPSKALDREHNSPLTWAAGNGHLEACQYLVDVCRMDPFLLTGRRKKRRCALHWAARNGHVEICRWLVLEKGVPVDVCTENDTTPLHFAIWTSCLPTVRWLVEGGKCDVNRQNAHGCTAAHWAAFSGDVSVLRYLQTVGLDLHHINGNRRSALHKAAVKGHAEACRWLLLPVEEGGGGLDERHMGPEKEGDHPWQLAASCGDFELESFLLQEFRRRAVKDSDAVAAFTIG